MKSSLQWKCLAFNSEWNWQNFASGTAAGTDTEIESNLAGAAERDTTRENKGGNSLLSWRP